MANGKIIFFGTSDICTPFLDGLIKKFKIELIITQPDRRGGRKNKIISSPVKQFAIENNIKYIQPEIFDIKTVEIIKEISPDIAVVIAYGKLIPTNVYQIPSFNTINVHFSLLPEYRGAAPVQRAIENGENKTGITIFEISKRMDAGKIWRTDEFMIEKDDTTRTMWNKLSNLGTPILLQTIEDILDNKIIKKRQEHSKSTYASPINKSEGKINWAKSARQIYNQFRAFEHWPGIFFIMNNKKFKFKTIAISELNHNKSSGEIIRLDKTGLFISCGNNSVLQIISFQPEGKKSMTPHIYSIGNKIDLSQNLSNNQ